MPSEWEEAWIEAHKDSERLRAAAEATGIAARLKAAGRGYYALSPAWLDKDANTVHFWLNPYEQKTYNYGWYSVAELDMWIEGKGPICEQKVKS